jgi:hypothetical protein
MRIFLAKAAAGGWPIQRLREREAKVLISYHYDRKELHESLPRHVATGTGARPQPDSQERDAG